MFVLDYGRRRIFRGMQDVLDPQGIRFRLRYKNVFPGKRAATGLPSYSRYVPITNRYGYDSLPRRTSRIVATSNTPFRSRFSRGTATRGFFRSFGRRRRRFRKHRRC